MAGPGYSCAVSFVHTLPLICYRIDQQINSRAGGMHAAASEAGESSYWHQPPRFHDIDRRIARYWRVGTP